MIKYREACYRTIFTLLIAALFWSSACLAKEADKREEPSPEATTTQNPDIAVDQLELLVKPLTKDELIVEADGWLELVKEKVAEVSAAEIAVKQKNKEIEKAKDLQEKIDKAKESLDNVKEAAQISQTDTTEQAAQKTVRGAEDASKAVNEVVATLEETQAAAESDAQNDTVQKAIKAAGAQEQPKSNEVISEETIKTAQKAQSATSKVTQTAKETQNAAKSGERATQERKAQELVTTAGDAQQALDTTNKSLEADINQSAEAEPDKGVDAEKLAQIESQEQKVVDASSEVKTKILDAVADLRDQRTALLDRFNIILDELNTKAGKTPEGKDNEVVVPYRLYAKSVDGIKVDVSDREAAWATIAGWLKSKEGGIRWAKNIAVFLATVIAFWILGRILGKLAEKALGLTRGGSILLRNFIVHSVRRVTFIIGIIIGLTALEVNIGPLLALIGAAGFVVAFALQNTLSNFASGIMIMLYKPFDVGDFVDVAGISGVVRSMNLVTTTITTADNQILVVPNNSIWGNIITNITGSEQRRVDLVFGIGYGDDISHARQVLERLVKAHPLVLQTPEPVIQVHELAESSVNFICRPWAKTSDYWTVYWDLTRQVKEHFDAEGISIPFPQRDVHIFQEPQQIPAESASAPASPSSKQKGSPADINNEDEGRPE